MKFPCWRRPDDRGATEPSVPVSFKYWAFISYSHQDKKWAEWLHKALETYRVPRRLAGTITREGRVPARVLPVFRDNDELPTSSDLNEAIRLALEQSRYLIVVCSPRAATSNWVNEEVLTFKRLRREQRILCFIVDGEPNAADKPYLQAQECFPQAVRYQINEDGTLSERRVEPLAADVRPGHSSRRHARLKIVAGILGIAFDDLRRREERRRRVRRCGISLFALAVLAVVSWAIYQYRLTQEANSHVGELRELRIKEKNLPFPRMSGRYTPDEVEQLKARVKATADAFALGEIFLEGGVVSPFDQSGTACRFSLAKAELAWAEGALQHALEHLEEAVARAKEHVEWAQDSVRAPPHPMGVFREHQGGSAFAQYQSAQSLYAETSLALVRLKQFLREQGLAAQPAPR
jgi:hypothetical protein